MAPSTASKVPTDEATLEADLLTAHATHDTVRLAHLYALAAKMSEDAGRSEEAGYRTTQAYVFALECGDTDLITTLKRKLIAAGREE